jgi:hypothetical protein
MDLKLKTERCAKCFAADTEVISQWAMSEEIAAKIYGSMEDTGYLPSMCQLDKGQFYVCYERSGAPLIELAVYP